MTPRTWIIVILAVIVGGIASVAVLEAVLAAYKQTFMTVTQPYPTSDDMVRITKARIESGTLSYGFTGALVGLMLGLAGGISRKSVKAAAVAGLLGLLIGGLVEGSTSRLALWLIYMKFDPQAEDILPSLLSHQALWDVVGLTGGLALGLGLGGPGRWWKTAIGGMIGAALAAVVFEFVGALVFSTHGTHQPVADSLETRIMAHLLIPLGSAIGAVLAARDPRPKPQSKSEAGPVEA